MSARLWGALLLGALFLARGALAVTGAPTAYHGGNEVIYAQVAESLMSGSNVPRLNGTPFYDTPSLTALSIASVWSTTGESFAGARLASVLAWAATALCALVIGRWRGEGALQRGLLVASVPLLVMFGGRAQNEAHLAASLATYLVLASHGGRMLAFLSAYPVLWALMSKQSAVLAFPLLWAWAKQDRWAALGGAVIGASTFALWIWLNAQWVGWAAVSNLWRRRDAGLFADWHDGLSMGLLLGGGLLVLALVFQWRQCRRPELIAGALFAVFGLATEPLGHAYYMVPALVLFAFAAPVWSKWPSWLRGGHVVAVPASVLLFLYVGGDLDPGVLPEAAGTVPPGTWVEGSLWEVLHWYGADVRADNTACPVAPGRLVLCADPQDACSLVQIYGSGPTKLFLMECVMA